MKKLVSLFILFCLHYAIAAGNIATAPNGTSDYNYIVSAIENTDFTIDLTKGDIENLRAILKSRDVMGVVQEDIYRDIVKKRPELKNELIFLSPLYKASMLIIAPKDKQIVGFKDLANRRVIVDEKGSGDFYTFLKLEEAALISAEIFNIPKKDALSYLRRGKVDAYFYVGDIDDIKALCKEYACIPVVDYRYKVGTFTIDQKNSLSTSYVVKYLVTTTKKEGQISKSDLHLLLGNLARKNRDFLCSFKEEGGMPIKDYIYFVCSENLSAPNKKRVPKFTPKKKTIISKELYYDNVEEITIYPKALYRKDFSDYGTSYIVEKTKLDNAVRLIKKELKIHPGSKIIIISQGDDADKNMRIVYKQLKRSGVPRGSIIRKIHTQECKDGCFLSTTITFQLP